MNIIKLINKTSVKQIVQTAFVICGLITIPMMIILNSLQTRLVSRADFKPSSSAPLFRGETPKIAPVITSVSPFLGKEGDVVIVNGENFGFYPHGARLKIGAFTVPENHLIEWKDFKVSFYLPTGAKSSQLILSNGFSSTSYPRIITIYDLTTKTKIAKGANSLFIANADDIAKVVIDWPEKSEEKVFAPALSASEAPAVLFDNINPHNISWITLFNSQGEAVSFYIDPLEFGY